MRRDLAHENLWARASKIGYIMMLRHPVALVAHGFCGHGQRNRLPQRVSRRAPGAHGRLIDDPKMQRCFHLCLPLWRDCVGAGPAGPFPATASAQGRLIQGGPFPASATAEGAQFNVPPFPATASAEGRQFNGAPSPLPRLAVFPLWTYPGLRPRQTGRAAVLVPTLLREWLPDSDALVEGHLRPTRWDKTTVHTMRTACDTPGGDSEHERLAKVVPGQSNMLIVRLHHLRPEGPVVTRLGKERLNHREVLISKRRIEQALDLALEPAGHGDVVSIDAH